FKPVNPGSNGGQRGYGQPAMQQAVAYGQVPAARKAEMQGPSQDAAALGREAQMKISHARAMSGGQPSGQTMFIMADTLKKVEQVTHKKDRRKTVRIVLAVVAVALAGMGGLGVVIWHQQQQLEKILHKKDSLDKQIQKIQLQMQLESDPDRLQSLE